MAAVTTAQRWARFAAVGAALIAVVAMAPVLGNGFTTLDDPQTIYSNWRIVPPSAEGVRWHWLHEHMSLYVPVTYTVWAAVSAISHAASGEARPVFFHAASVVLHALAAVAVFGWVLTLLDALLPVPEKGGKSKPIDRRPFVIAAFCGAAVFAIHRLQVESVAWTSGLKDVLMGMLSILSLWALTRAAASRPGNGIRIKWLIAAGGLMVLAILAKPTAVVLPVMALPLLRLIGWPWRRVATVVAAGLVLALPFVIIGKSVQPAHLAVDGGPIWARPLIAGDAYAFYLMKLVWPVNLTHDYGRTPPAVLESGVVYWTWLVPVLLAGGLFVLRKRIPLISSGALMAAVPILPVSGLVTFEFQAYSTVADHYTYLAFAGLAVAMAGLVQPLQTRPSLWKPLAGAGIAIGIALLILDWRQARTWRDTRSLYTQALAVNPRSYSAYNMLATLAVEDGRLDEALSLVRKSLEIRPNHPNSLTTLGNVLHLRGDLAGAEEAYRTALQAAPNDPIVLANYGGMMAEMGRADEALPLLRRAVEVDPDHAPAQLNLGTLLASAGQFRAAEPHLRAAVRLTPRDPRALTNLAIVLLELGRSAEARDLLQRALAVDPNFAPAQNVLGL